MKYIESYTYDYHTRDTTLYCNCMPPVHQRHISHHTTHSIRKCNCMPPMDKIHKSHQKTKILWGMQSGRNTPNASALHAICLCGCVYESARGMPIKFVFMHAWNAVYIEKKGGEGREKEREREKEIEKWRDREGQRENERRSFGRGEGETERERERKERARLYIRG